MCTKPKWICSHASPIFAKILSYMFPNLPDEALPAILIGIVINSCVSHRYTVRQLSLAEMQTLYNYGVLC